MCIRDRSRNPHLRHFFKHAKPLFEEPLTISQISFEQKTPIHDHIFMLGDSAGLIHPLCGNGMAMALHSAKLFADNFLLYLTEHRTIEALERTYAEEWYTTFSDRLRTGRYVQQLLLHPVLAKTSYKVARVFPGIVTKIIKRTHGCLLYTSPSPRD